MTPTGNRPEQPAEPPVLLILLPTPARLSIDEIPDPDKLYLKKEFVHNRFSQQLIQLIQDENIALSSCNKGEQARIRQAVLLGGNSNNILVRPCHVFYVNRPNRRRGRDVVGDVAKEQAIIDQILRDEFSFPVPLRR